MDFGRIPFHSVIDRFGHLLPLGPFTRLSTVLPFQESANIPIQSVCVATLGEYTDESGVVSVNLQSCKEVSDNVDGFEGPPNDYYISCHTLNIYSTDGIYPEAFRCTHRLTTHVASRAVLSVLRTGVRCFTIGEEAKEPEFTLLELFAFVGPNISCVHLSHKFPGIFDLAPLAGVIRGDKRISYFDVDVPSLTDALTWLHRNMDFFIDGGIANDSSVRIRNRCQPTPKDGMQQRHRFDFIQSLPDCRHRFVRFESDTFVQITAADRADWRDFDTTCTHFGQNAIITVSVGVKMCTMSLTAHLNNFLIESPNGNPNVPTCVSYRNEVVTVGEEANDDLHEAPSFVVYDFLEWFGKKYSEIVIDPTWGFQIVETDNDEFEISVETAIGRRQMRPEEILAQLLTMLNEHAREATGIPGTPFFELPSELANEHLLEAVERTKMLTGFGFRFSVVEVA